MAANFNTSIGIHPSIGFKKNSKVTVDTAKFGDGYSQRTVSGLNPREDEFNVTFVNQPIATAASIISFLETAGTGDPTRGGVDYFFWTPPDGATQLKIVCSEWDETYASSISRTINAKFMRVYDL